MELNEDLVIGQTPLDEEEMDGLLIPSIMTQGDLNEFEQMNIEQAIQWTLRARIRKDQLLTAEFLKRLHKEMFGKVWKWAGEFRKTEKNIGVKSYRINVELRTLLEDCMYWIEHDTYPPDEIAVRFKHRLVFIHCFANGNGRHSRLMADLIITKIFDLPVFSWNDSRGNYIKAVKAADLNDLTPLLELARR